MTWLPMERLGVPGICARNEGTDYPSLTAYCLRILLVGQPELGRRADVVAASANCPRLCPAPSRWPKSLKKYQLISSDAAGGYRPAVRVVAAERLTRSRAAEGRDCARGRRPRQRVPEMMALRATCAIVPPEIKPAKICQRIKRRCAGARSEPIPRAAKGAGFRNPARS